MRLRKLQEKIPASATGTSSLKFSIKDTLILMEGVPRSVKFLHDGLANVAGVYVQVHHRSGSISSDASYYFDVPEAKGISESDSISLILIGFDPTDIVLPVSFDIIITPYDESGQPLDETELPVTVDNVTDQPDASALCGIVNAVGEYWNGSLLFTTNLISSLNRWSRSQVSISMDVVPMVFLPLRTTAYLNHQRLIYFQTGYEKDF